MHHFTYLEITGSLGVSCDTKRGILLSSLWEKVIISFVFRYFPLGNCKLELKIGSLGYCSMLCIENQNDRRFVLTLVPSHL